MRVMLAHFLRPFFWDIDAGTFDPAAYPEYTIGRLLERGDSEAVAWLRSTFSEAEIRRVLVTERRLSRKSASFWALVYGVPASRIAALKHA
jgi:hypothetical protein